MAEPTTEAEATLRRTLGRLCSLFGALYLIPVAYARFFSEAASAARLTPRGWSLFFYAHFIALVTTGFGLQVLSAARTKLFYGGPFIDFLLTVAAFMISETFSGVALRHGLGPSWPALVPGLILMVFGARLSTTRPLLGS